MQLGARRRSFLPLLCLAIGIAWLSLGAGAGAAAAQPGKITVSSTAITGQTGKTLLVFALPQQGPDTGGRICAQIDESPFILAPTVVTDQPPDNPCGPPTPETVFPAGTYGVFAGVYQPGSQTPEKEAKVIVELDGDESVELDGSLLSAGALPILDQLAGCLEATNVAWGLNNQTKQWVSFDPDLPPALQGVTQLMPGGGYFLNTSADCMIDYGDNHVSTYTGWNLFGWR
ncbi:MAG: hypothetical protein HYY03_08320 [Chloroflexi bacterium]|nr:hypothetical protein [Chloroflexota bacterium]